MKNYIQVGDIVTVPAPASVSSGDGVLVGALFGVAVSDAESGNPVEIMTTGVFELAKNSAEAWTVGADVYWDDTNKVVTTVDTSNTLIGKALAVAANPSGVSMVRLNG